MRDIYLYSIINETRVEGPGLRTALWTQGCSIRCEGCMIPGTWDFTKDKPYNVDRLVSKIISNSNIEGITILGGEPFDQAEALEYLIKEVKDKSDLSIMLFTGYRKEYLRKRHSHRFDSIISKVDIFIEGPYVKEKTDFSREWVGSGNQKIHFLTERYSHLEKAVYKDPDKHSVEIRLSKNGMVQINGMLPKEKLEELINQVKDPCQAGNLVSE